MACIPLTKTIQYLFSRFVFLTNTTTVTSYRQHKNKFLDDLTSIIDSGNLVLISSFINKIKLLDSSNVPANPYHLALGFCLETLFSFLKETNQHEALTHIVVERRGVKEDQELELEFRRLCGGENLYGIALPFEIIFADKKTNSPGLQIADLAARPIGLSVLRPRQENRAFDVLQRKMYP